MTPTELARERGILMGSGGRAEAEIQQSKVRALKKIADLEKEQKTRDLSFEEQQELIASRRIVGSNLN